MGRWEPGAAGRLHEAAMELYVERGFEQTTVAEIAQRAGVTARTFFRHYADKREVLFGGSEYLLAELSRALGTAPDGATPMEAVAIVLDAVAELLGTDREHSRRRQSIIDLNAELRERELIKMSRLAGALAGGLRDRGVAEPEATLAAEAGMVVLRVGFRRWVDSADAVDLRGEMRSALTALRTTVTDQPASRKPDQPTSRKPDQPASRKPD
ncbi:TetR family transcriptional regulator [Actinoplanes sp. NPDC051851]|uniref:TetR/AcrR family transcriptional regulator n=1 Tax=Actinoplanes sp. NPDC051851 TaxID=3154753 RepID=UPI0034319DFE